MSIFRKEQEAPEVEVRDGEIVINKRDDAGGEGDETRKVKLPKTKWA